MEDKHLISVSHLKNRLGGQWVHEDVSFTIDRGEIIGVIGASGCGKTTLLKSLLMLRQQDGGEIALFGQRLDLLDSAEKNAVRSRLGVMFQSGALFSSLSVLENITYPMTENNDRIPADTMAEIARLKLVMVGLDPSVGEKYPSELSGGMKKRVAIARALAMDPELVFLDEPTAGLDPQSASAMDELVLALRDELGITFVVVTHDLDSLWRMTDRVIYLGEGRVLAAEPMSTLVQHSHPSIQAYFSGSRSEQRIRSSHDGQ